MQQSALTSNSIELVHRFRSLRALVIGDAMLDTYLEGKATRLCSEGPIPVVRKTETCHIPGGAANCAANLRTLGAEVTLLGVIGQDNTGSLLRNALYAHSISTELLLETEIETTHKVRILADGQHLVRFDEGGEKGQFYPPHVRQHLLASLERAYRTCDLVVVSDYGYGVLFADMIQRLQQLQKQDSRIILVDSKDLKLFRSLSATVVTPNVIEACTLLESTGVTYSVPMEQSHTLIQVGKQVKSLLAAENVALTLGAQGVVIVSQKEQAFHLPAHPVPHANDVGAGDSFAAALALALAAGGNLEESAHIALHAAALSVAQQRTTVVQHQELLQRLCLHVGTTTTTIPRKQGKKMVDVHELVQHLATKRASGKTIVFTNGIFDILHAGHNQFLRQARALGDLLVVGINSDSSAHRLRGPGRPINTARDRMALVASLDVVDYVLLFDEDAPLHVVRLLQPDFHVKGGNYREEDLPESQIVREGGGRVVILPLISPMTTSSVIARILALPLASSKEG